MSDDLLDRLREVAYYRAGGGPSETNYDPDLLEVMTEAANEIERLRREVDEQCRLNSIGSEREARLLTINRQLESEYTALKLDAERLRKDAERYRWLRCRANPAPMVFMRHPDGSLRWRGALHGDGLDAAIDAAIGLMHNDD